MRSSRFVPVTLALFLLPVWAKTPDRKLKKQEMPIHALERLTYGPRPGDLAQLKKTGIKRWIEQQLHPESIPADPALEEKLKRLETIHSTPLQIWREYPQSQMIKNALTGKPALPDDAEFRETVQHWAGLYKLNDEAALVSVLPLEDVLPQEEIRALKSGKPDERRQALASIPQEKVDEVLVAMGPQLRNQLQGYASIETRRRILALNSPQQLLSYDLLAAKLYRAIYSPRQLGEQLVDFWFNHFNVYLDKGNDRFLVPIYEEKAIRPHVLGKFRDLLQATAESPAMLYYLDNYQSVAPKPKSPRGLNENYARELLELHTLGVDGGYTQKDIIEVARCFTGWTIRDVKQGSEFWFNEKAHDQGEKQVLGVTIPAGGGKQDALQVLDILVHHPSTARFISKKLAQRFVSDNPPKQLIDSMAKTFRVTDGDLRAVMRTMLNSREFWSLSAYRAKLKSPLEMIASAARATGADVEDAYALANQIGTLGQPLYRKVEPTGYSNTSEEWINTGALLSRLNFALNFTQNRVSGVKVKPDGWTTDAEEIAQQLLFHPLTPQSREAITASVAQRQAQAKNKAKAVTPGIVAGLVLGSPDFQRR